MPPKKTQRHLQGVFYTPAPLAEWMVRRTLGYWHSLSDSPPVILDPACGNGAFLRPAQQQLAQSDSPAASLYGVDLDHNALNELRNSIATASSLTTEDLQHHFQTGNALTGLDWKSVPTDWTTGINWPQSFPEIAARGGFDIIIANPPYVREKETRKIFDEIAATPLGKLWRQPRMDLWHYFLHRSLDLIRPNGLIGMVVNSYWMQARSAERLIERLEKTASFLEIIDFSTFPLFDEVQGHHMIFWLQKNNAHANCRISRLVPEKLSCTTLPDLLHSLDRNSSPHWTHLELPHSDLIHNNKIHLSPPTPLAIKTTPLENDFEVRQGVAENPPVITRQHLLHHPGHWQHGEGVFVLTSSEVHRLNLSPDESSLLRPYWETRELDRYNSPRVPTRWLLYLTPQTAPDIAALPRIHQHLERFLPLLTPRREVQRNVIQWWHLHWPREERLFRHPRLVSIQMGSRPRFLYTDQPAVVGFSCHILLPRNQTSWSLPALCALLNSHWAEIWFTRHAKHRGKKLDLSGTLLKQFPLPPRNPVADAQLHSLSSQRAALATMPDSAESHSQIEFLEQQINTLVADCYNPGNAS